MTATLEFMVPRGESEAFNTALYLFLELKLGAVGDEVKLESTPFGPVDRKRVTLWSEAALAEFIDYWSVSRRSRRALRL